MHITSCGEGESGGGGEEGGGYIGGFTLTDAR